MDITKLLQTFVQYFLAASIFGCFSGAVQPHRVRAKRSLNKSVLPGQSFTLNCPHASNNPPYSRLIVTWMLDGAIWLKILNGMPIINNKLISKNTRKIGRRHVVSVVLNDYRYEYYYDEVVGDFNMNIRHSLPEDSGVWQCDVEIFRQNGEAQKYSSYCHLTVGSVVDSIVTASPPDSGIMNNPAVNNDGERVVFEREKNAENKRNGPRDDPYEKTKSAESVKLSKFLLLPTLIVFIFALFGVIA